MSTHPRVRGFNLLALTWKSKQSAPIFFRISVHMHRKRVQMSRQFKDKYSLYIIISYAELEFKMKRREIFSLNSTGKTDQNNRTTIKPHNLLNSCLKFKGFQLMYANVMLIEKEYIQKNESRRKLILLE